ncbi:hypothetical protein LUZ60_011737 [Juncus effusus]|nr:hypothetical protein LUZ60_011737 [Juncus effusus]
MDPFHYQPQPKPEQELEPYLTNSNSHNSNKNHQNNPSNTNNYMCRQVSTRWIPTSEQIRILRDLYYNCGIRSPNSDEIQRISAMLRQYGKIEGKNVFYWFQNHKARERQKKKLVVDVGNKGVNHHGNNGNGLLESPVGVVTPPGGVSAPSSSGCFYGVVPTERNFIDLKMNATGEREAPQMQTNNRNLELELNSTNPWLLQPHTDPQLSPATIAVTRELETLQLFPVKAEPEFQIHHVCQEPSYHFSQFTTNSGFYNPSFYYNHLQQNQEINNQNMNHQYIYGSQPSTTSLELTLGSSLFFSPPM